MKWTVLALVICVAAVTQGRDEGDGRLVARFSTRTLVSVTTTTATVPVHCISAVGTGTCLNRRRRRDLSPIALETDDSSPLEGSQELSERVERDVDDRDARVGFTLWKTVTSTFTFTSTSTDTATTVSASFACSVADFTAPFPNC
ncbi:uncharacterized protein LOC119573223 [Penaeus monodon]|uniref:uncharacterized protein LOC119573223 n=1 Tax=Penaeus monodon TaxID=6687 RepID=UPI0018A772BD|nr:uncharacterized protein LOC119573223 [Penaeus monodon]